jgi:hypothetical protein
MEKKIMEKKMIHQICPQGHEWLAEKETSRYCRQCVFEDAKAARLKERYAFLAEFPDCYVLAWTLYPDDGSIMYGVIREIREHLRPIHIVSNADGD